MKKRRFPIPLRYLLPVVVLLCALIGGAVAKYVTTVDVTGAVTFNASLATSVEVKESEAVRNTNGSYTLNTANTVTENSYELIPGLDIPKDPHVVITGKTPIEAYLFIEVVDQDSDNNDTLTYTVDTTEWKSVTEITDKAVYVYTGGEADAKKITNADMDADNKLTAYILDKNTVTVSQKLKTAGIDGTLTFTAKLVEVQKGLDLYKHY